MTAPLQVTLIIAHPLGLAPALAASAAIAPNGPVQFTTAWSTDPNYPTQPPGPLTPPVIS